MPAGQHEAVAAGPVRVGRVVAQEPLEQQVAPPGPGSSPCRGGRCRPSARRPWPGRGRCRRRAGRGRSTRSRWTFRRCFVDVSATALLVSTGVAMSALTRRHRRMSAQVTTSLPEVAGCLRDALCWRRAERSAGAITLAWSDPFSSRRPCVTAVDARPPRRGRTVAATGTPGQILRAYVALTKPRIIELLLVTTVPTMILAAGGLPGLELVARDPGRRHARRGQRQHAELLPRPRHRRGDAPHRASPAGDRRGHAAGGAGLRPRARRRGRRCSADGDRELAAGAARARGDPFYVVVYTLLLKRRTPQNIVWGGAAGCMPVLIGWAAVTGSLSWTPVVLFAGHLLLDAAALLAAVDALPRRLRGGRRADAARRGGRRDGRRGADRRLRWLMVGDLAAAVAGRRRPAALRRASPWCSGRVPASRRTRLHRRARAGGTAPALGAMRLFHGSITYLALLFLAVAIDPLLRLRLITLPRVLSAGSPDRSSPRDRARG